MTSAPLLSGRRIVITGASRGLGRALAIMAADHGANLVLLGRNQTALGVVADIISARSGRDVVIVECDLAQADSVTGACQQTLSTMPVVDVLENRVPE